MADCIICRIVVGEIPSKRVYEDDRAIAFHDIAPAAPFHVLVVPRAHVATFADLEDGALGAHLLEVVRRVAREAGHAESFRMVVNNGDRAGQTVRHLHFHVLAGRQFSWPPG